jgi:hypothetical protein
VPLEQGLFRVGGAFDSECESASKQCFINDKAVKSMNFARGNVGLALVQVRSEQNAAYQKDYVFVVGGCAQKHALQKVERYTPRGDLWTTMPDLSTARISPSAIAILDYLYVFGGKNQTGYLKSIERLNLKNATKFEGIDVQMNEGCTDTGLVPMMQSANSCEIMILGGFNGKNSLNHRHKFIVANSCSPFACSDGSQGATTDHLMENVTSQGDQMRPDFFTGCTMFTSEIMKDGK